MPRLTNKRVKLTTEEKKEYRIKWLKKNKSKYFCKYCKFGTPHTSNYKIHLLRKRHIKNVKNVKKRILENELKIRENLKKIKINNQIMKMLKKEIEKEILKKN